MLQNVSVSGIQVDQKAMTDIDPFKHFIYEKNSIHFNHVFVILVAQ